MLRRVVSAGYSELSGWIREPSRPHSPETASAVRNLRTTFSGRAARGGFAQRRGTLKVLRCCSNHVRVTIEGMRPFTSITVDLPRPCYAPRPGGRLRGFRKARGVRRDSLGGDLDRRDEGSRPLIGDSRDGAALAFFADARAARSEAGTYFAVHVPDRPLPRTFGGRVGRPLRVGRVSPADR